MMHTGLAGTWCSIREWENNCIEDKFVIGYVEQFILFYGPAIVASLANIVVIFMIICFLGCYGKCKDDDEIPALIHVERKKRCKALRELLPLLAYPIIFCIILVPPLFSRTYDVFVTVKSKNINDSIADITSFFFVGCCFCTDVELASWISFDCSHMRFKVAKKVLFYMALTEIGPFHY